MSTKSGRGACKIKLPRYGYVCAVSALVLGAIVSVTPASAATVSYNVAFSLSGFSSFNSSSSGTYENGTATGSFDITYDPTIAAGAGYSDQSITGVISNLKYTVTDPTLGGTITLNPITTFTFSSGTLALYSDYAADQSKSFTGIPDLVIGINGLPVSPPSGESAAGDVWFSVINDQYNETSSGTATFTQLLGGGTQTTTPLPATLPLFATGLGTLGLLGWRRKRKNAAIAA